MGIVQCMTCRQELPCPCIEEVIRHKHTRSRPEPRRSVAVPETLDLAATERLWQAMRREQREGSD